MNGCAWLKPPPPLASQPDGTDIYTTTTWGRGEAKQQRKGITFHRDFLLAWNGWWRCDLSRFSRIDFSLLIDKWMYCSVDGVSHRRLSVPCQCGQQQWDKVVGSMTGIWEFIIRSWSGSPSIVSLGGGQSSVREVIWSRPGDCDENSIIGWLLICCVAAWSQKQKE